MRLSAWPLACAAVASTLGMAGLIRASIAQSPAAAPGASAAGPIVVTKAYVVAPVPPSRTAAAYFTVHNTTDFDDRLLSVETGAGPTAVLHTLTHGGSMRAEPNGVIVHAHSKLVLATGRGHVMIEHVYRGVRPGQTVNLEVDFQKAGPIDVVAPVVKVGQSHPGGH